MLEAAIFVIFPFCMAYAAVSDMVSMTIANRVSLILVASFVVIAALTGMAMPQIGTHLLAGLVVLCVTFSLFALGVMGGGDAKLLAATAVWIGYDLLLLQYLVKASVLGGVLTLLILGYRRSPLSDVTGGYLFLRNFADPKEGVPYGIVLGLAGLIVYPETPLAQWAMARLSAM